MFELMPFRRGGNDITSLFDEMEKSFMHNFGRHLPTIKTDIVDKGDRYILKADIPGFNKEDISIFVENNKLTITAKENVIKEENTENYIRRERRYGSLTRSFDVSDVKTDEIKADYKNGVLVLDLPKKKNGQRAKKIDIL